MIMKKLSEINKSKNAEEDEQSHRSKEGRIQMNESHTFFNNWEEKYFNKFQSFLVKNKGRIMTYHQVLNKTSNSKLKKLIRNFLKLTLLNVRKFKN